MKDLADRLVAMSPQPPPFPEDVTVTQPSKSRPSPVLMFAGAAVIVLILAAIPILILNRGGGEVVASTTTSTVPATETTEQTVTSSTQQPTTTVPETTTTHPVQELVGTIVFLVQEPENSFTGNPAVVPFFALAESVPEEPELTALRLLTTDGLSLPPGFSTMIPDGVDVVGVERDPEGHRITIDMNQAFVQGAGGLLADFTMLNQLIFTVTSEGGFTEVLFTSGGEPITAYGTEGLDLTTPVGRDSFLDQLNSVIVDSAVTGSGDSPLNVTGIANVFEATVSLQLVDLDGTVVYEDFTTASCGTGCWGSFSFHIEGFDFESRPLNLKVFWNSAEDGSPSDVVSIPVSWGEPWNFLPQ
jgi:spore germination protein GerM